MYKHATIDGKFRPAAAIGFKGSNPYPSTTNSNAKGIKFGFCDVVRFTHIECRIEIDYCVIMNTI